MGWTFFRDNRELSRADVIRREFSQPWEPGRHGYGFESIAERGATVYAVMFHQHPDGLKNYFGMVFLTSRRSGQFGYKDIGEECGPSESRAPKGMIRRLETLAPAPNEWAKQWRARCLGA